jgi:hypothetical protein
MTNWARATQPVYAGRRGRRAPPSIEASEAKATVAARDPAIQLLGACQRGLQRGAKRCAPVKVHQLWRAREQPTR